MGSPNSSRVRVAGTGAIWKAPLGTPIPTDSTTAWNAAFINFGYVTDGFEVKQDLKTQGIGAWQTTEWVRLLKNELARTVSFEGIQSDRATTSLAWGGATVIPSAGSPVGGAITIGTAGVLTSATAHGLTVGQVVQLATVVTSTGITALTPYYVIAVPTTTTLTLSATSGGAALTTTAGTGTGLALYGAYQLDLVEPNAASDFILGLDWSDGTTNQRIIVQQASQLSLPTIKFSKSDAVRYPLEVQALKPADGTDSILIYGVDAAMIAAS